MVEAGVVDIVGCAGVDEVAAMIGTDRARYDRTSSLAVDLDGMEIGSGDAGFVAIWPTLFELHRASTDGAHRFPFVSCCCPHPDSVRYLG